MKIEKKIYNSWAFTQNENEKGKMNREIYDELINKYKVESISQEFISKTDLDDYDVVLSSKAEYGHTVYTVVKAPDELTTDELLLIADRGNLCFGGSGSGSRLAVFND